MPVDLNHLHKMTLSNKMGQTDEWGSWPDKLQTWFWLHLMNLGWARKGSDKNLGGSKSIRHNLSLFNQPVNV